MKRIVRASCHYILQYFLEQRERERERERERNENFGDDVMLKIFDFTARAMRLSDDYTSF